VSLLHLFSRKIFFQRKVKTNKAEDNRDVPCLPPGVLRLICVYRMLVDKPRVLFCYRITGQVAEELPAFA
jgi:hypothetical protein